MIDKKKIQEAAQGYCDATYGTLKTESMAMEGFKVGANWAISQFKKSLWHDAKEQPKKGETCLVYARFTYEDKEPIEDYFTSTYTTYGWTEDWFPNDYDGATFQTCCHRNEVSYEKEYHRLFKSIREASNILYYHYPAKRNRLGAAQI